MPLWLPTLEATDAESLLSWQQAPALDAAEARAPLQAPLQQLEEEDLIAEDEDSSSLAFD
jgi:hypothetical protein